MDFGRKILSKYGWKEGDGLGKDNHGIAKPLKATLKFDNAGFGADQAAEDFNNHWWERVFNEAANNVNVKQVGDKIKVDLKDVNNGVEISTKSYSMKKLKKIKQNRGNHNEVKKDYDNFLQAATIINLRDDIENPYKIDISDIEVNKVKVLKDEELFKACGGRTAHKAARHGFKLSGKLLRIEQQEAELLAKMMEKRKNISEDSTHIVKTKNEQRLKNIEHKEDGQSEPIKKKKKTKNKEKTQKQCKIKKQGEREIPQELCCKSDKMKREYCEGENEFIEAKPENKLERSKKKKRKYVSED